MSYLRVPMKQCVVLPKPIHRPHIHRTFKQSTNNNSETTSTTVTPLTSTNQKNEITYFGIEKQRLLEVIQGLTIGGLMGSFGSVLGVGGGIVAIPLFLSWAKFSQHEAHATSVVAIACSSTVASTTYLFGNSVDVPSGLVLGASAAITARFGALRSKQVSEGLLRMLLAILLCLLGPLFLLKTFQEETRKDTKQPTSQTTTTTSLESSFAHPKWPYPFLVGLGSVTGFCAGLLGVGGGLIMTPLMRLHNDLTEQPNISQQVILGTSLMAMAPSALVSAYTHYTIGNVRTRFVAPLLVGSAVGSYAGSKLSLGVDEKYLKWVFAVAVFGFGTNMLLKRKK